MLVYKNAQIKYSLLFEILLVLIFVMLFFFFIMPRYEVLGNQIDSTNALITEYHTVESDGITYGNLVTIAKRNNKLQLIALVENYKSDVQKSIVKSGSTATYEAWLTDAKQISLSEQYLVSRKFAFINSIIPTLHESELFWTKEEPITLSALVRYVEGNILGKYDVTSLSPIGIQTISYTDSNILKEYGASTGSIGYFDITFDIEGQNTNIEDMVEGIEKLGDPANLGDINDVNAPSPAIMSNPLVTIENLSLNNNITTDNRYEMNAGSMTLRFYVRGASKGDIEAIQAKIKETIATLKTSILNTEKTCNAEVARCEDLKSIESAINEIEKNAESLINVKGNEVAQLNVLSQLSASIDEIQRRLDEFIALNSTTESFTTTTSRTGSTSTWSTGSTAQ